MHLKAVPNIWVDKVVEVVVSLSMMINKLLEFFLLFQHFHLYIL